MISDGRRLRIYRVVSTGGILSLDQGAECWQDVTGRICGVGLWYDLMVPVYEDLMAQAQAKNISALEWLRCKLESTTFIRVEVI